MKRTNAPLKVCLIAPLPPPIGGISNWVNMLLHNTPKNIAIYKCINISPKRRTTEGRTLWERIIVSGFDILSKKKQLRKTLRQFSPDVIHMTTSGQLAILRDIVLIKVANRKGIPTFYHIRYGRLSTIKGKNTLEWKLILHAMKLATKVIVIDKNTFNAVENEPNINAVLIPNPILIQESYLRNIQTTNSISFLGWVVKTKGIEELLGAWEELSMENENWRLNLIGPYNINYLKLLKKSYSFHNVNILGEKTHNEAMVVIQKSKIFILPSYTEGFPNSILEAMALKKPIIATKVGAIPEMLSGDCGILISPYSKIEIKSSLITLIEDETLRKEISANAFKKVKTHYSFEKVLSMYHNIWTS